MCLYSKCPTEMSVNAAKQNAVIGQNSVTIMYPVSIKSIYTHLHGGFEANVVLPKNNSDHALLPVFFLECLVLHR